MAPQVNATFAGNVSTTLTGNTAAVASGGTLGGFIDGIKLVLGLMAILTPIPVIAILFSLQLPIFFLMMISIPLWLIATELRQLNKRK
jgi:Ca2+/Na+ antiporter